MMDKLCEWNSKLDVVDFGFLFVGAFSWIFFGIAGIGFGCIGGMVNPFTAISFLIFIAISFVAIMVSFFKGVVLLKYWLDVKCIERKLEKFPNRQNSIGGIPY